MACHPMAAPEITFESRSHIFRRQFVMPHSHPPTAEQFPDPHEESLSANPWDRARPPRHGKKRKPVTDEPSLDEVLSKIAEPWNEDRTRFKPELVLQGKTYHMPPLFEVPAYPADPDQTPQKFLLRSPHGEFAYMNRLWRRGQGIPLLQNRRTGIVVWDQDVVIPVLLDGRSLAVWMSLTPMEVFTLREGISMAKGTVIIGGLGMGYLLRKVCEKTTVERVIVVEQSRELLEWFGNGLCAAQPKVTDIICGDAYDQLGKFGDQARYLFDIWPVYGDATEDPQFQTAKQQHSAVWGWGDYRLPEPRK